MKSLCSHAYKHTHTHHKLIDQSYHYKYIIKIPYIILNFILIDVHISTSEQEACKEKSLKQLITHCSISKPRVSNVLTVDRSNPGLGEQHISTRVSSSLRSTSNYPKT